MSRHVPRHTFQCPPPPPLHVMVARPAQATQVTQLPITLVHEPLHCVPCHPPPPPMSWWHKGERSSSCDLEIYIDLYRESKSHRGRIQCRTTQHNTA